MQAMFSLQMQAVYSVIEVFLHELYIQLHIC